MHAIPIYETLTAVVLVVVPCIAVAAWLDGINARATARRDAREQLRRSIERRSLRA